MSNEELAAAIEAAHAKVVRAYQSGPVFDALLKHLKDLLEAQRMRSLKDDRCRYGY